ncbi:ribonuclease Z [Novosphingobium sp. CF614]|uniref:MBL fold metallo-hydrolase n=1 Tax=Novosphingobium sp. CF614 TaxID=1884364 RepID=UPI0008F3EA97|nr:MBL fold metallo-hydrolase [Novosphingobium sp. CF614]SFF76020.1 ribonuclease Z [Novosphingobium sp. CF614]
MRTLFGLLSLLLLSLPIPAMAGEPPMKVILLGTAGPEYFPDRLGPATLIVAGGQVLLFDCGRGVGQRLYESRVNPRDISRIFLTHLHGDHFDGLPELWMTPWFLLGRDHGFDLWGPEGSAEMVAGMRAMYSHDLTRRVNPFNPVQGLDIRVHKVAAGTVFEHDGVKVTAFPVEHAEGNPAFGYAVEWQGRKVVLSGDTTYSEALVTAARDADLLVQNVIAFSDRLDGKPEMQGVLAKLTTPEQAARMAQLARPKLMVFSHIVTKDLTEPEAADRIVARTRAAGYAGALVIGEDRMTFELGDTVTMAPPPSLETLVPLDSKDQRFP